VSILKSHGVDPDLVEFQLPNNHMDIEVDPINKDLDEATRGIATIDITADKDIDALIDALKNMAISNL
jgi:hypothetical protein